jgi:hypothetical protein
MMWRPGLIVKGKSLKMRPAVSKGKMAPPAKYKGEKGNKI